MKKILFLFFAILFLAQFTNAQETYFQTGHTHDILEVHFSPDDTQLVSYSGGDGNFILWDVESGRQIWTRKTSFIRKAKESINLKEFYWSKDGKTLVTKSTNGTYQTWDALTGKVLALTETKPEIELIVPNKKQVSYTKDYGNLSISAPDGTTKTFKRFGNNSAFDTSNSGEMFAEGAGWGDASIKITEIKTGKSWWLDGHPSVIGGIAFSPDGKFLAVGGSDRNIYIFDVANKQLSDKIVGNSKPIISLAFSPNGDRLVSVEKNGFLRVWDWKIKTQVKQIEFEFPFAPKIAKFSPDGKNLLMVNDSSGMELWETNSWKQILKFCADEEDLNYECGHKAVSTAFSQDGKLIFAGYENGTIRIWDLKQKRFLKKIKYGNEENYVTPIGNGKKFLVASKQEDLPMKIFDSLTGKEINKLKNSDIDGFVDVLEFNPNGKNFLTSGISGFQLWNLNKLKLIREFEIGFSDDDSIAFSSDGKTFAVGGRNQNLFLFNVETGEKLWQLISSYQPGELEIQLEERGKKGRAEVEARKAARDKKAEREVPMLAKKITAKFSHFGDAESFWDQKIAESGAANKSKLKLPKAKAKVVWFTLTNGADLPVVIDTNSMIFNPKCKGLCDGAEISSRYVLELKTGETNVNGYDSYSKTILPPEITVYFSVSLEHFAASKAIYLGFTFQKDNPDDERSSDYGTEQKLFLSAADLPK